MNLYKNYIRKSSRQCFEDGVASVVNRTPLERLDIWTSIYDPDEKNPTPMVEYHPGVCGQHYFISKKKFEVERKDKDETLAKPKVELYFVIKLPEQFALQQKMVDILTKKRKVERFLKDVSTRIARRTEQLTNQRNAFNRFVEQSMSVQSPSMYQWFRNLECLASEQ